MKKTFRILALVLFTTVSGYLLVNAGETDAAALSESYIFLSRMEADIASDVEMIVAIGTTTSMTSGGTLTIQFPDADDANWCRTAGTLTVTGVAASAADAATAVDIDSALTSSSTFSGTCTQGSGASSYDTFTIANVGAMTGGTVYGVQISGNTAIVGTDDNTAIDHITTLSVTDGVNTDSSSFDVELVADDTVTITATVAAAPTITCSISTTSADIGTLYAGGSFSTVAHSITATTSADAGGYYWTVYGTGDNTTDAGLYKSTATTYLIPSTGSATVNLNSVEGFGLTASTAAGSTVATDFLTGTPGVFGALDIGYAGAQMLAYQAAAEVGGDTATITYGARAGNSAEAGAYTENVTFVCGGYY